MKIRQILCSILIFLFCSLAYAKNSRLAGIELCSDVHSFLKKNGFSPSTQSLLASGENTFPYNIIVTFSPEQNTSPENLLLIFFQDDVPDNQEIIKESLEEIKTYDYRKDCPNLQFGVGQNLKNEQQFFKMIDEYFDIIKQIDKIFKAFEEDKAKNSLEGIKRIVGDIEEITKKLF